MRGKAFKICFLARNHWQARRWGLKKIGASSYFGRLNIGTRGKLMERFPSPELFIVNRLRFMRAKKSTPLHLYTCGRYASTLPALLLTLLLMGGLAANSLQAQELSRQERKTERKALKEAEKYIEYTEYRNALPHLERAYEVNPDNPQTNFWIGLSYMNSGRKDKALPYLERALELDPEVDERLKGLYARVLHYNNRIDEATRYYREYLGTLRTGDEEYGEIIRRIEQCRNAKVLLRDTVNVLIENLGDGVNSPYPDYVPVLSADETVMIFTSRRPENKGEEALDGFKYEDLYIVERQGNNQWGAARNMGSPVNSLYHDASASLSADGQTLFIYRDETRSVYESHLRGEEWRAPQELPKVISGKRTWEPHACLSPDGNTLYFVSDREGGEGGLDIYAATRNEEGQWDNPQNLGPTVNTPYDERGPFMHADGVTLYFSSEGHSSMGGLDIFKTVKQPNGKWSRVENMGYPVNTSDDDVYFMMSASGTRGYYASNRRGGIGEKDIYRITFRSEPVEELASQQVRPDVQASDINLATRPNAVTILKGVVTDEETGEVLDATVVVTDNDTGEEIARMTANSSTGKYLTSLPAGGNYGIAVEKTGYLFHSEHFELDIAIGYQEIIRDIELKPLKKGSKIILRNIFFDFDKYDLREESAAELERLVTIMEDNPSLKIRINGHTDSRGSDAYNETLSKNRAQAVVEYLIEAGIAEDRLQSKGFGESDPIATNDTDEGRQKNRRTEFEIIEF